MTSGGGALAAVEASPARIIWARVASRTPPPAGLPSCCYALQVGFLPLRAHGDERGVLLGGVDVLEDGVGADHEGVPHDGLGDGQHLAVDGGYSV